ncbi:MAG: hypothetical protein K6T63_05400 [Alicyclobacillus herbarius]|nr:hypothetical protein [Alicyclobacillus herbarius]MCL6632052.1 hypothetical protein [Alicyclobacillus herbarius]
MEAHGPLYHRNGAHIWPRGLAIGLVSLAIAAIVAEIVLGIASLVI